MRRIVPNPLKPNTSPLSPQEPCVLPRDQKATYNRRDFTSIAHCAHPSSSSVLFLSNTAAFQSLFTILSRDCRLRTDPTLCFCTLSLYLVREVLWISGNATPPTPRARFQYLWRRGLRLVQTHVERIHVPFSSPSLPSPLDFPRRCFYLV